MTMFSIDTWKHMFKVYCLFEYNFLVHDAALMNLFALE